MRSGFVWKLVLVPNPGLGYKLAIRVFSVARCVGFEVGSVAFVSRLGLLVSF